MRAAALAALAAAAAAQDAAPVFVELTAERPACYRHEVFALRLRVGVERAFLRENALQPFRQALDLPVRVEARALADLGDAVALDDPPPVRGPTLVVNDALARGVWLPDRDVGGRPFAVVEVTRRFRAPRAAELVAPAPVARFTYATAFREDFLDGRVPADRHEGEATGAELRLAVLPLPRAGRPPGFADAVGAFALTAAVEPRVLRVGEALTLTLRIEGEGNLAALTAPPLDDLAGFHVRGSADDRGALVRAIAYELVPLSTAVREVPRVALPFFDPRPPAGYHTARSEPVPIEVRPGPGGAAIDVPRAGPERVPGEDDLFPIDAVGMRAPAAPRAGLPWALLAVPWLGAFAFAAWRSVRRRHAANAADRLARGAAAAFLRGEGDLGARLASFLAANLRCPQPALLGPDLPARLRDHGVPPALADRAAAALAALVDARFAVRAPGGRAEPPAAVAVAELVADLDAVLHPAEARP